MMDCFSPSPIRCDNLFIYLGFYVAFNTVQVISRRVVGRAEETIRTKQYAEIEISKVCEYFY